MGLELGSPTWWEADSLVTVKWKLERVYYGCVGKSLPNDSPCKGKLLAVNREKQERQAHETSVHRKGRTNACHLSGTSDVLLWDCLSADNSLYLSRRTCTMREIQNVGCLDAFPLVPPKPHSRQPSLSALLLGVANREVSQAEESARILSGRYSLRYLLANPLPCLSLRLVPRV